MNIKIGDMIQYIDKNTSRKRYAIVREIIREGELWGSFANSVEEAKARWNLDRNAWTWIAPHLVTVVKQRQKNLPTWF